MLQRRVQGFTLIELMITVAIVAIIAAIAYPAYTEQVRKGRRAEAKAALVEMMNRQERFYSQNNAYTDDLTDINYAAANNVPSSAETNGGNGWYSVDAAFCTAGDSSCVTLTATPRIADPRCGNLSLDSLDQRQETGSLTVADCW